MRYKAVRKTTSHSGNVILEEELSQKATLRHYALLLIEQDKKRIMMDPQVRMDLQAKKIELEWVIMEVKSGAD